MATGELFAPFFLHVLCAQLKSSYLAENTDGASECELLQSLSEEENHAPVGMKKLLRSSSSASSSAAAKRKKGQRKEVIEASHAITTKVHSFSRKYDEGHAMVIKKIKYL